MIVYTATEISWAHKAPPIIIIASIPPVFKLLIKASQAKALISSLRPKPSARILATWTS